MCSTSDADGRGTRLYLTSAGYDYTFSYDAMGRFETIKPTGGVVSFQYKYDVASNEVERDNYSNAVNQFYTRDNLSRMSERDVKLNTSVISSEAYGYDVMSRLTSVDREDGKRDAFGYDLLGELTSAQYGLQNSGASAAAAINPLLGPVGDNLSTPPAPETWTNPQRRVDYIFDKSGNRTSLTDAGMFTGYSATNLNQYWQAGTDPVTNGSEHEIAAYQNISYGYINDGRLSSVSGNGNSYQLNYDALGRTAVRALNGVETYYIYDWEKPILEYGGAYALKAANLYGKATDEILKRTDYSVTPTLILYYQDDHEGSVTHLTNATGQVIESYRYDAFGKPTIFNSTSQPISSSTVGNRFMFTGREYAAQFGIYEYRARAYHPGLGRFMSEDPKLFDAGDYNLFRYCGNDPEDRTDPMGLDVGPSDPDKWQVKMSVTGTNIPATAQNLIKTRQLVGLSTTRALSAQSAKEGLQMGQVGATPQQGGVPAKVEAVRDPNGNQVVDNYSPTQKIFPFQVEDSKGRPFKEANMTNQESLIYSNAPPANTRTSGPKKVSKEGIIKDVVGPVKKEGPGVNGTRINQFSEKVSWNGYPYSLSTQVRQEIVFERGVPTHISATTIEPGQPNYK